MDRDKALEALTQETKRYRRAKKAADEAQERIAAAIVEARKAGATPTEVDHRSPFTPTWNRKIARRAGVPSARPKATE